MGLSGTIPGIPHTGYNNFLVFQYHFIFPDSFIPSPFFPFHLNPINIFPPAASTKCLLNFNAQRLLNPHSSFHPRAESEIPQNLISWFIAHFCRHKSVLNSACMDSFNPLLALGNMLQSVALHSEVCSAQSGRKQTYTLKNTV